MGSGGALAHDLLRPMALNGRTRRWWNRRTLARSTIWQQKDRQMDCEQIVPLTMGTNVAKDNAKKRIDVDDDEDDDDYDDIDDIDDNDANDDDVDDNAKDDDDDDETKWRALVS